MIDLADLTENDIGRAVVYHNEPESVERGVITSWNSTYVFVKYDGTQQSAATNPEWLEWECTLTLSSMGGFASGRTDSTIPHVSNTPKGFRMGYSAKVASSSFRIDSSKKFAAMEAIKQFMCDRSFPYVDDDEVLDAESLRDVMACWGWSTKKDPSGNIIGLSYTWEKLGDNDTLFAALAPFVAKGSFIEMVGEDGYRWRWYFDGEKCITQKAVITYE